MDSSCSIELDHPYHHDNPYSDEEEELAFVVRTAEGRGDTSPCLDSDDSPHLDVTGNGGMVVTPVASKNKGKKNVPRSVTLSKRGQILLDSAIRSRGSSFDSVPASEKEEKEGRLQRGSSPVVSLSHGTLPSSINASELPNVSHPREEEEQEVSIPLEQSVKEINHKEKSVEEEPTLVHFSVVRENHDPGAARPDKDDSAIELVNVSVYSEPKGNQSKSGLSGTKPQREHSGGSKMSTSSAAPSWEVRELPDKPDGISFFSPDRTMQDVVHSTDQIVQDFFDEVKQRHQRENLISQSRQTALAEYDPHLSSTTIMAREREADWRRYVQKCKQLPHDREEDREWGDVAKFRQKETFREMLSEVTKSLYDREKDEESSPTISFLTTEGVKRQYREKAERQLVLELCFAVKPFVKELLLLLMQYAEKDHQRGGQGSALFHPERTASSVTLAQCAEAMNELFSRYKVRTTRATSTLCGKIVSFTGDAAACSVHRVEYALFVSAIVQKANEPPE